MLAYFLTKPLHGNTFIWMQEKILNLPSGTSTTVHRSVLRSENKSNGENKNNEESPSRSVIWAYRIKDSPTKVNTEKSLEFKFKQEIMG